VFIRLLADATNPALPAYDMPMQLHVRRINTSWDMSFSRCTLRSKAVESRYR
jgi:hypothetical protein